MNQALLQAKKAFCLDEVPVGACLVQNGDILSLGHNTRENQQDPLGHAEIFVIKQASKQLKSFRLESAELFVSLEPCLMCFGALLEARISRLVFAARDLKKGFLNQLKEPATSLKIESGLYEKESRELLQTFFQKLRQ